MKTIYDPTRKIFQPVVSEENVVRQITVFCALKNIILFRHRERIPGKGQLSTPGISDLFGYCLLIPSKDPAVTFSILPPQMAGMVLAQPMPVFIEVKRKGGRRMPHQIAWIKERRSHGCMAFFAESVEDVIKEFEFEGIKL